MRLLVLGGTVFLGRYIVEAALARGHEVTLFNRGHHGPELFQGVEKLRGDRDGNLAALEGRRWDAVVDTCGYLPRVVRQSARLLAHSVEHYTFISSISVYRSFQTPGTTEASPVGTLDDPAVEQVTGETYGPLKALCEQEVESALPGRALVIRPGLIVGPHDQSDRFPYWLGRVARGGEVLAPSRPELHVQLIDVRDLAEWSVRMVEERQTGVYNATGPDDLLTMGRLLEACRQVTASDAWFTWVSEAFLLESGVVPWSELPLWLPDQSDPDVVGFSDVDVRRAIGAGLRFRPLATTAHDTWMWDQTRPSGAERRAGLAPEREAQVLQAWHARTKQETR